jgi:D-alanyl-lipoteichoic acid acyltransferase DltB (MBOAT superfamily)
MLFNSNAFVFVFLPIVAAGFFGLRRTLGLRIAIAFLLAASLFFYGFWNPAYVALIAFSIAFNFTVGRCIESRTGVRGHRRWLVLGIAVDLGLLGYFKYANFFVANLETLTGRSLGWAEVTLPIAISFFTFQQIAYLVDTWRGERHAYTLLDYALFVSFFPQLIAGPIVHHRELLPQLADGARLRLSASNLSVGLTIFIAGLFKKAVLADTMAGFSTPVFAAAEGDAAIAFVDAWGGALAYTFQIYFDFSGYSDMAIGLARLFGLRLPVNFESPYKAASIIDFWRRWHITLSRFLRDYLYIPLGGNRRGARRRYLNLWATMLLGGLWHGAGWNFLLWGGLHGGYLVANHLWRSWRPDAASASRAVRAACVVLTFASTVIAWVPFRAESQHATQRMWTAMFAPTQLADGGDLASWTHVGKYPEGPEAAPRVPLLDFTHSDARFWILEPLDVDAGGAWWIALCLVLVWALPNTREWMAAYDYGIETYPSPPASGVPPARWQPGVGWALYTAVLAFAAILAMQGRLSEFI